MQLSEKKQLFIYMLVAYIFSIVVRMIWVYQFSGVDNFMWNGQLMINTNDGYVFAEKARDILNGSIGYSEGVDGNGAVGFITALFINILPFSFETIILYMPTFLGSLLVIPLVLIGYSLKQTYLGFIAALLGSIVWSYYNRTMTGYYDSDMLNIVMPMLVLWSIIHSILVQKNRYLVLMITFMLLSQWWYPKNISLNTAMIFMGIIYVLIKDRNNFFNFKFILFGLIGLSLIPVYVKISLALAFFGLFHYKEKLTQKYIYPVLAGSFVLFMYSGAFGTIWSSLDLYLFNRFFPDDIVSATSQLNFYSVISTVREASAISFETFANRISGHTITFTIATIGVIIMMIRNPILLISLPMVAMGFMAYKSGLRFTVYAVPIYALGFVYFLFWISHYFERFMQNKEQVKSVKTTFIFIAMMLALYPNITHIIGYKVPTVLNKIEVNDLVKLDQLASDKDYTLAWWDYGYPIRYYSDTNTLIDGGKHQNDNYVISKIMQSTSQNLVANLSRLAVETYVLPKNGVVANSLFENSNPKKLLNKLATSTYVLPKKTRDIYLYFPFRMMNIFPTVAVFGNLNLQTGRKERNFIFYPTAPLKQDGSQVVLQNGIVFDYTKGTVSLGKSLQKVYHFDQVTLGQNSIPKVESSLMHVDGTFCVVYLKSYNKIIVMDRKTYKSAYVQMFMLGNYDKNLFELVISSPYSKIYKLKK